MRVSIPHRYAKNQRCVNIAGIAGHVSIPHRYAKNSLFRVPIHVRYCVSIPHRYAKNGAASITVTIEALFQFLIGTLKTQAANHNCSKSNLVSIPHRYAKNLSLKLMLARSVTSFNSS